jgi:hypothetical protein
MSTTYKINTILDTRERKYRNGSNQSLPLANLQYSLVGESGIRGCHGLGRLSEVSYI